MEVHSKQLSVFVGITKKVADVAVIASFPVKGVSNNCLKKLKCNCVDNQELVKGSQEAAACFALYEVVRDKLVSSPLELSRSRVSDVECNYIDENLSIRWNCQGTVSSVRKTIGLFLTVLHPEKLYGKYSDNIKFLSGKSGHKEEFVYCANKLIEGIKKHIQIVAVGKINIDKDKLEGMMDVLEKKIPHYENTDKGSPPQHEHEGEAKFEFFAIPATGIAAACLADYIRTNSGGMGVDIMNKDVIIYNKSWPSKQRQLADTRRIKDYVEKKYERLGDEFPSLFAYFIITQDYSNSHTAYKVIKSKQQPDKLSSLIKDHLK